MSTFLPAMCAAFFIRVRPASRKAKPACMNMTRIAAMTTQTVLAAIRRFALLISSRPPRARRVCDRFDNGRRDLVLDDERQESLWQKARLEDAPSVLVGDAALASVAD